MSQEWKAESADEDDVQMPLGVGGGTEVAAEEYTERRPRMNTSTIALFAAFGAALVVLYLLGLGNKPRAVSADEEIHRTQVNNAIEEMIKNKGGAGGIDHLIGNTSKLVKILMTYLGSKPVEPLDLPGDPFVTAERTVRQDPDHGHDPIVSLAPDPRIRVAAEVYAGLKLSSVMIGSTPAALITQGAKQRMVTVGAEIDPWVVTDIQPGRVLLTFEKNTVELKLNAPAMEKP